jgi:hypothetical protein
VKTSSLGFEFTRAQWRHLLDLRRLDMIWASSMRRDTIDALVLADVAYETDTGHVRLSSAGRAATLLAGRRIIWETVSLSRDNRGS